MGRGGLQERFESSKLGRLLISAFLVPTLIFVAATNLPQSSLRHDVLKAGTPFLNATGLDQVWSVFAPDPRRVGLDLEAHIDYQDGTTSTWRWPHGGGLVDQYWDYRWQKWLENVILDARADQLWRPAATYIARHGAKPGSPPTRVTLVRRWYRLYPPGSRGRGRGKWRRYAYFKLNLMPPGSEGTAVK